MSNWRNIISDWDFLATVNEELSKLSIKEYKNKFNSFANNWRFCMRESIRNAGTQILKELRRQAPLYWKQKYNDDLLYLITFVAGGNNGAVYKADNWSQIGQTSGLPPHKSISMKWDTHESLKEKYVKPTGENKKLIFFKRIRTKQEHLSSKTY